ncbi:MAG: hypothetical protein AABZ36_00380 [Nitrospirota bacterium]
MIRNSYLRLFLVVGIPIFIFLVAFFSFLLGLKEGLIPGLLIGLFVGSLISCVLGFIYSKTGKEAITALSKNVESGRVKQKNEKLIFLPYAILLLGAIYTRYTGKILPSFILTISLSITVFILVSYFSEELKKSLWEEGYVILITYTITQVLPFTITYICIVFMLYGFDLKKIVELFK